MNTAALCMSAPAPTTATQPAKHEKPVHLADLVQWCWTPKLVSKLGHKPIDPVTVAFTAPVSGKVRELTMPFGTTPWSADIVELFELDYPVRISGRDGVDALSIIELEFDVLGTKVHRTCAYWQVRDLPQFGGERTRVGKTERDRASDTRGSKPTGRGAIPGPAKGLGGSKPSQHTTDPKKIAKMQRRAAAKGK